MEVGAGLTPAQATSPAHVQGPSEGTFQNKEARGGAGGLCQQAPCRASRKEMLFFRAHSWWLWRPGALGEERCLQMAFLSFWVCLSTSARWVGVGGPWEDHGACRVFWGPALWPHT